MSAGVLVSVDVFNAAHGAALVHSLNSPGHFVFLTPTIPRPGWERLRGWRAFSPLSGTASEDCPLPLLVGFSRQAEHPHFLSLISSLYE